jgi:hypothetical protein
MRKYLGWHLALLFFFIEASLTSTWAESSSVAPPVRPRFIANCTSGIGINEVADKKTGKTPLMLAVESGDSELIIYLLERGADPSLRDTNGENALDLAKRLHSTSIEQLLRRQTALHPPASDYYQEKHPKISIVSGQNQMGNPNGILFNPLIVAVTDSKGNPMPNAPVRFEINKGDGSLMTSGQSPTSQMLELRTDQQGQCFVYFKGSNQMNYQSWITAKITRDGEKGNVVFQANTDNGQGKYPTRFGISDVVANINIDGSADITWVSHDIDEDEGAGIIITYIDPDGNLAPLCTAPVWATSKHLPPK